MCVNFTEETLKGLEEWAKTQKRTTSNLATAIVTSALEPYQQGVYTDPVAIPRNFRALVFILPGESS